MAFKEAPRFPVGISRGVKFGPRFSFDVVEKSGGHEQRNQNWAEPLRFGDCAHAVKNQIQLDELYDFFYTVAECMANAFRVEDPTDYRVSTANGRLGEVGATTAGAVGTGYASYQMFKRRSTAGGTKDRVITKPVAGGGVIYRNASPVTVGAGAGNIAIDATIGVVTFVADDSEGLATHTPGATHVFTTAADISGLAIGKKVYISGVTGTAAATLNSLVHTITNKSGAGPYTWTLSTVTTGLTASGGTAFSFPQASDALTWEGPFDTPCRFDTSSMSPSVDDYSIYSWREIPLREVRIGADGQEA